MYQRIIYHVEGAWSVLHALLNGLWRRVDDSRIIRRMVLFFTLYLTWVAYEWAFAIPVKDVSWDVGAVIGAVLTPISALQAAVFKFYSEARNNADPTQGYRLDDRPDAAGRPADVGN
jgi:hypothetical protein